MKHPRLKAHLLPVTTPTGQTFLLTETDAHLLSGPQLGALARQLDGRRTLAEIISAGPLSAAAGIMLATRSSARAGMLGEGPETLPAGQTAFWEGIGQDAAIVADRIGRSVVTLRTVGSADAGSLAGLLRANGITVAHDTDDTDNAAGPAAPSASGGQADDEDNQRRTLTVVVADDYARPELAAINAEQLTKGEAWILLKPTGYWPWYGPLMVPGTTGCWDCLRRRLDINRMVEQYLRQFHGMTDPQVLTRASLPSARGVIEALTVTAITTFLATGDHATVGRVLAHDVSGDEFSRHQLIKQPQCPACGDPKVLHRDPRVLLEGQPIAFSTDGGFRSMPPEATYQRLEKHVSRITGAISWLSPLPTDDSGISYAFVAGHNFAMSRNDVNVLRKNLRGNSGGKGRTEIQAKVSGMCEAIERYSGVWEPDRPTVHGRADQLDARAVMPGDLMLWADEQYDHRDALNADPTNMLHRVPRRFDPAGDIDWTATWSMTRGEPVYVPAAYAWFGHPECAGRFETYSDGNGNAAGNTLEEAVLQGFLELVERDAVGIWWYNRLQRPSVDLATLNEPYFEEVTAYYDGLGRDLWVLDITSDLGVPVFAAVSRRRHGVEDIIVAFGAHLDPKLAALRAVTEANQFLPAVFQRDAEGNTVYLEGDTDTLQWWRTQTVEGNPWLTPTDRVIGREDHPLPPVVTVADCVQHLVDLVAAKGMETLVLDQSRPDIELRVAKVMVPGLRHFWRRLGRGRLFDVPVEMGERTEPTSYADLNPISVFF